MPELPGVEHAPLMTGPAERRWPPPYPGLPRGLESLSAVEAAYWGHVFGEDVPYLWAPSGWGEEVVLIGDLSNVDPAHIIEGRREATEPLPPAPPGVEYRLYPHVGFYPHAGLYPA